MIVDHRKRLFFEELADLFDEVRPGYPEELVENVVGLSSIPSDGRILDIGCGSGNATLVFARRGYRILGIELGERLAALATRNCRAYPLVEIRNSSFEDCELEEGAFDLVVSADAFHWIVPEVGYPKAAKALKDSGSVAFFWNVPVDPATDWSRAIDDVYQTVCPGSDNPDRAFTVEWLTGVVPKALETYGGFGGVTIRRYPRSLKLTSGQYLKMLRTRSTQAGFDEATRNRLFAGIRSVIERFGGEVLKPQLTVLFHARVKR